MYVAMYVLWIQTVVKQVDITITKNQALQIQLYLVYSV